MWRRGLLGAIIGVTFGAALALWATGSPGYFVLMVVVPSVALPLLIVVQVMTAARRAEVPNRSIDGVGAVRWRRRGLVAAVALVAAALVVTPVAHLLGRGVADTAAGRFDADNLLTGRYQQETMAELLEVVGAPAVTGVVFFDDYVIVTAPTRPGLRTTDTFTYRWGSADRDGPDLIQSSPAELAAELFDASTVDFSKIPAMVAQAKQLSGVTEPTSTSAQVRRQSVRVSGENVDMVVFSVSVSDDYYSAFVTSRLDGSVVATSGSAFDR